MRLSLLVIALLTGCNGDKDTAGDTSPAPGDEGGGDGGGGDDTAPEDSAAADGDGDGFEDGDDCDDEDDAVHPGADEVCDGVDNDCDEAIDEDAIDASTWYADGDGDGYGDPAVATEGCDDGAGVADHTDCDDADSSRNPGAAEIACDGVDSDCDGADTTGVIWTAAGGVSEDVSAAFLSGTEGSPAEYSVTDAGTLTFCDGTWFTTLYVTADGVTVSSRNGAALTTLSSGGNGTVITVSAPGGSVALQGLTLSDGDATYGGAVLSTKDGTELSIEDCVIRESTAVKGAGVYLTNGALTVTSSEIADNTATSDGGGVYLLDATAVVTDSTFSGNQSSAYGGGLYINTSSYSSGTRLSVSGSTFADNVASRGGGLYTYYPAIAVKESEFYDNTAGYAGGGVYTDYNSSSFTDVSIYNNTATYGGGLYGYWGTTTVTCSTTGGVWGNQASYGGGMHIAYTGAVTSKSCDWGSGSTDNDVADVMLGYGGYKTDAYGSSASFTCSGSLFSCY